jgi:hypothetical protein
MAADEAGPEVPAAGGSRLVTLRSVTLVIATILALLGGLGQFLLLGGLEAQIAARAGEMRDIEAKITTLRTTQNDYFNAYVQGNLLFALNPADLSVNRGVTAKMYQLTIYDRGFPFRNILAELAIAGTFDFKTVNDRYRALADAARDKLDFATYNALNEFEKSILDQALDLQHRLQDRYFGAQAEMADAERRRDTRRMALIVINAFGTCLLLAANLMAERRRSG